MSRKKVNLTAGKTESAPWIQNKLTKYSFFYFQAAERHLARETGEIRIATLQARFLQCMYLLSRARINQSYSVFGTLVNFVFSLGIHRERTPSSKPDLLELEMQKRVFWTTYVLDKYLSSALGRPQMFHDEDIDQQLPFMVDENSLSPSFLQIMTEDLSCPMEGAIYQIKYIFLSPIAHLP